MEAEATELAGLALLRLGDFSEAQRRFASSTAKARANGISSRTFTGAALGAYTAHRTGDDDERDRKFAEAMAVDPPPVSRCALRLLAIRMQSPVWMSWRVDDLANEPVLTSILSLMRAREAAHAANIELARRELRRARAEGVDTSEVREEAELLADELGMPSQLLPADPPYPNILRWVAVFDLEARRKQPSH